ncbi:MAG: hypothetical protein AAF789_14350 [Bacteroidota bacterium]
MKYLLSATFFVSIIGAFPQEFPKLQFEAYSKADRVLWVQSIAQASSRYGEVSLEKALACYGLLNNTFYSMDQETFEENIEDAIQLLKKLQKKNEHHAEAKALLSSLYSFWIGYDPEKIKTLSAEGSQLLIEAYEGDSLSPIVLNTIGDNKLYAPVEAGGEPELAFTYYSKAVYSYEQESTKSNWMYVKTLLGLAAAQQKTKRRKEAMLTLNKVLVVIPNHPWALSMKKDLSE